MKHTHVFPAAAAATIATAVVVGFSQIFACDLLSLIYRFLFLSVPVTTLISSSPLFCCFWREKLQISFLCAQSGPPNALYYICYNVTFDLCTMNHFFFSLAILVFFSFTYPIQLHAFSMASKNYYCYSKERGTHTQKKMCAHETKRNETKRSDCVFICINCVCVVCECIMVKYIHLICTE